MSGWDNGFSLERKVKGIMLSAAIKFLLGLYLCTILVNSSESSPNVTTTTTTTTEVSRDLSGAATGRFETSVKMDHSESTSRSKSHSYSYGSEPYAHKGTAYENSQYEDQTSQYGKDPISHDGFYKGSDENNSYRQQHSQQHPQQYSQQYSQQHPQQHPQQHSQQHPQQYNSHPQPDSYEPAYEQPHYQRIPEHGYGKRNEKDAKYSYPDHSSNDQSQYGHQEYSKESYESAEDERYRAGPAPYVPQYAYEVSHKQQQASYDPLDVPDSPGKSGYGPEENKAYSPQELQQPEYYPKLKPTRYLSKSSHSEEYQNKEENYFPAIPKEAGYVSNGQKEPGYLQAPSKEPSYSQQAGYFSRHQETSGPKENEAGLSDGGKVAIFIKHLGHKDSQNVPKERQGYLLLPILPHKVEQKLAELKEGNFGTEYKQAYPIDKEPVHQVPQQRQVQEKEVYVHQKVSQEKYEVEPKVAIPYDDEDYSHQNQGSGQPLSKGIISQHASYGGFRPIGHPAYPESPYEAPKVVQVHSYSSRGIPQENHGPYLPTAVEHYKSEKEIKTYSGAPLIYDEPHGVVSSYSGASKYKPVTVYKKVSDYISPYDVTTLHKSAPIKISGLRPSIYSHLPHGAEYRRLPDYSSLSRKPKNSGTSQLYSTDYRNVGARLATEYEHPNLDTASKKPKSLAIFLQKTKEQEHIAYRPSTYSPKSPAAPETLVDLGLHGYDSLRSVPKSRGASVGSLYYKLHTYPVGPHYGPINIGKEVKKYY